VLFRSGYKPSAGNIILKLEFSGGVYTNVANWTIKLLLEPNGNGYTNGDGTVAQMQNPDAGIEIIGYDSTIGDTSGTHPIFLLSDYDNGCYRDFRHNGGISGTEAANWSMSTPAYCGTQGGTTFTFGANPEYGSVRGTAYIGTTLYGCGEGSPNRIIYKVTNFGDTANDFSTKLFGNGNGYLEQTAY
jgi:hypothetical protein